MPASVESSPPYKVTSLIAIAKGDRVYFDIDTSSRYQPADTRRGPVERVSLRLQEA